MGKTRAGCFALRGQRMALLHLETMTQAVDSADSVDPRALEALNRYFGYDSFRPGQSGIVSAILTGRDVLGVMPTGAANPSAIRFLQRSCRASPSSSRR